MLHLSEQLKKKSLIQHFNLSVAMSNLHKNFMLGGGLLNKRFYKKFSPNIHNKTAIKTSFHFSHYKSMETLSCHSNQSAYATAIKNNSFVEANAMNISAKFQLHPPYSFWGVDFLICFANWAFWFPWQPIRLRGLDKNMFDRGPLNTPL